MFVSCKRPSPPWSLTYAPSVPLGWLLAAAVLACRPLSSHHVSAFPSLQIPRSLSSPSTSDCCPNNTHCRPEFLPAFVPTVVPWPLSAAPSAVYHSRLPSPHVPQSIENSAPPPPMCFSASRI